jgi:hypothetical protein
LPKLLRTQPLTTAHTLLRIAQEFLCRPPGEGVNDLEQADDLGANRRELRFDRDQFAHGIALAASFGIDRASTLLQFGGQGQVFLHSIEQSGEQLASGGGGHPGGDAIPDNRPQPRYMEHGRESSRDDILGLIGIQALCGRQLNKAFRCRDTLCSKFR